MCSTILAASSEFLHVSHFIRPDDLRRVLLAPFCAHLAGNGMFDFTRRSAMRGCAINTAKAPPGPIRARHFA